ncbi:MAG: hypothetical protein ACO3EY_03600 [Candidatus Nanopelagicales bacterium]
MKTQPQLFVRRYEDVNDPTAWTLLDLYNAEPIKMNLRVQDVMEPSVAVASYSQTFRVPHSSSNGKFFQQAFNVNQTLFDPAKKAQAYINNEGQLWMMGVIQLMNVYRTDATDSIEYEISFMSETSDFATQIGLNVGSETAGNQGGFLTNLDLSKYSHELNYANIVSSWNQTLGGVGGEPGDIVYPLIEWGYNYTGSGTGTYPIIPTMSTTGSTGSTGSQSFTNSNFPLLQGQMKPALRVKAIWDAIFDRTGYTYESEYIQGNSYVSPNGVTGSKYGDEFKDLYIISDKYARATLYESGETGGTGPIQAVGAKLSSTYFYASPDSTYPPTNQIGGLNPMYDLGSNFDPLTQVFTVSVPGQYTFEFQGSYQLESYPLPTGSEYFLFSLRTNNGYLTYDFGVDNFASGVNYGSITAYVTYTFVEGDTFQFYGSIVGSPNIQTAYFTSVQITTVGVPAGNNFNVKAVLPDNIKQIDFIKSIVQRFKLVFEPSKTDPKNFIITPWNDWIRQGTVKDWTAKLNDKKSYKLTPLFQKQTRFMTFKDQEDSDYLNYNYQQARKQVYGQLNKDSQIDIIVGNTDVQGIFGTLPLGPIGYGAGALSNDVQAAETFLIPHIAKDTPSNDGPGKREPIQPKLRLAWYNQLCGATGPDSVVSKNWYLKDDSGTAQVQDKVPLMSSFYPHPWSDSSYLLDWNVSTPTWNSGITGNPSGFTNDTVFGRFWQTWYDSTYGQINTVTLPNGQTIQSRDYAYIFEGEFILDYKDIIDFRFNDLIWIKDAYYLVNSINDYVVGEKSPCKVVLYKLNNIGLAIPNNNFPVDGICYSTESICDAACCQLISPISVVFVEDPLDITVGTRLFLNAAGTIWAPAGYYSDGTYVYTVDTLAQVTVIDTIGSSPALCNCIPDLDPLELCYYGATGDACLACCCQGTTGEFWMQNNDPASWYTNTVIFANSTGSAYPPTGWYAYDNQNYVYLNNGIRTQSGSCSSCNCLIYDLTQFTGCTGSTLCNASCCTSNLNYTFWADSDDLNTATVLFSNQTGTPVADGWYYNGLAAVQVSGGTGAIAATGDPGSCEPCANETLDVYFNFLSNVNGTGSFVIERSFNGASFMPESTKDLSTISAGTTFNYTGAVATGTFVRGTLVYGASHDTGVFTTKIEGGSTLNSQNTVKFSTYSYTPVNSTTGGREFRFSVNLTGPIYNCALTGGTAWKCTTPECNITGGNSVYVWDTNTEVCCDPLYIYENGTGSVYNNTEVFINGNCTGATGTCYICNDYLTDSYSGSDYHLYDPYYICEDLSTTTVSFNWFVYDRPNRFNLYNAFGLVATSGWVGYANYPGPWGASLSTPSSGVIGAPYSAGMYITVEAGNANPANPISDSWEGTISCSNTCYQYINYDFGTWVGDYQDCEGTWYYGANIGPGASVCAVYGSVYTIFGMPLTQTYSCNS